MKRKFLNIISCFLALFIFVGSFVFYVPSRVSASSNYTQVNDDFSVPNFANNADIDVDFLRQLYDAVYLNNTSVSNKGYTSSNSFLAVSIVSTGTYRMQICKLQPYFHITTGENIPYYALSSLTFSTVQFVSNYEFGNFNLTTYDMSDTSYTNRLYFVDRTPKFGYFLGDAQGYMYGVKFVNFTPNNEVVSIIHDYSFPFDPILSPILDYPYNLNIQSQGFTEWLISSGKYREISSSLLSNHVSGFVNIFKDYGGSFSFFKKYCSEFFDYSHIYGVSDFNIVLSKTKSLYQEYLRLRSDTVGNHLLPRVESSIVPETNDSNQILVTNSVDDTTIISLLRDILRSFIALPNTLNDLTQLVINKLDSLDLTTNIVNNGGTSNIDLNPVLTKMDDIIDKLEADTVSVDIDQTTKDDTDDFFDDWNLEFSTALNNKFPVASQLRTFFTGFFERCGIDADSDGEVYQYYNPGVLTSSSFSRSAGTASEADIVSDFLGKFDNSDPTFLDDASFQGVPDLSVSVGGHSVSIIDFRVYAKYRDKIHFIISFVIWTLYLLHLYKALPSIIGQVADVAVKTSDL